jgi:hypothetical protein
MSKKVEEQEFVLSLAYEKTPRDLRRQHRKAVDRLKAENRRLHQLLDELRLKYDNLKSHAKSVVVAVATSKTLEITPDFNVIDRAKDLQHLLEK